MFGFGVRIENLSPADVRAALDAGEIVLIDVREPDEFASASIPGSVNYPLSRFDPTALPAADGKRLVTTCRSGQRSQRAAAIAARAGVSIDAHLAGGILAWAAAGQKVA